MPEVLPRGLEQRIKATEMNHKKAQLCRQLDRMILTAWVIWFFTLSLKRPSKTNESPNFSALKHKNKKIMSKGAAC